MKNVFAFFMLFVCYSTTLIAQQYKAFAIPDSLKNMKYKELAVKFNRNRTDLKKIESYAKTYLQKGKSENIETRIAQGYHFMSFLNDNNSLELIYLDSAIFVTKKLKKSDYPAVCYVMKGDYYFKKRDFKKALDNYIIGSKYAKESHIVELEYRIKFNIGLLKTRLGDFNESIQIFDYCNKYYFKINDINNHLLSLFALSDANVRLKKYKEATLINKKGYLTSLQYKDSRMKNYFTLEEGVNQYWQHNYKTSIDSITKILFSIKAIDDKPNLAMGYYYLGIDYFELGNKDKAILYFKKVDEIFKSLNDLHPDTRKGYELLINYYKEKGDTKSQLNYIEQLMKLDNILNTNYKYLSRKIDSEYDTPQLISEKEKVIAQLNKKEFFSTFKIATLLSVIFILLVIVLYFFKKQKRHQYNFEKLILTQESNERNKELELHNTKQISTAIPNQYIQPHIIAEIQGKLNQFEENLGFLSKECNLNKVSDDFTTNIKYLSKIINDKKGVSFPVYINELRIDYVITELQKNKKFRSYTIKAIGETVGFNTAETFSKAFFNKTGIQPSYFIKELNNKELELH